MIPSRQRTSLRMLLVSNVVVIEIPCFYSPPACLPDNSRLVKGLSAPSKPHLPFFSSFFSTSFPLFSSHLTPSLLVKVQLLRNSGEQCLSTHEKEKKCEKEGKKPTKKRRSQRRQNVFRFDEIPQIYSHSLCGTKSFFCPSLSSFFCSLMFSLYFFNSLCPFLQFTNDR